MSGTITSGVGLLSGLPTQDIIDQLMAIESRPITLLNTRVRTIQTQRTAFAEISARLLGLKNTVARLDETRFFRASKANSSDESVLSATTGENAVRGTFSFRVKSLVTNHQLISAGFADSDGQAVGAGTLSLEIGNGRLDRATPLDQLNGGAGVRRGKIEIRDSLGNSAVVDLSTALTVEDVLREINGRTDVRVAARVQGDHLVIEDQGGGTATLSVRDVGGGRTAADLGILGQSASAGGEITGKAVVYLSDTTLLSVLNDGNGVSVGKTNRDIDITVGDQTFTVGLRGLLSAGAAGQSATGTRFEVLNGGRGVRQGTFRITNRAGEFKNIVVDDTIKTIGDVVSLINNRGINVTAFVGAAEGQLNIRDNSSPSSDKAVLKIEDVEGYAAADLGIVGETKPKSDSSKPNEDAQTTLAGKVIYRISTIGDVLRAINYSYSYSHSIDGSRRDASDIEARISPTGRGIEIVSRDGQEFTVGVAAGAIESDAARDLGLMGKSTRGGEFRSRDVLAGLNTVLLSSLRGGQGMWLGQAFLQAADGSAVTIDFSGAATVQDIIDLVNAQTGTSKISARLNNAGTGIVFADESGATGETVLADITGGTIGDLFGIEGIEGTERGVVTDFANGVRDTGNVQLQYISRATKLADLNYGRGIALGSLRITARNGRSSVPVPITENQKTVGDLLTRINSLLFSGVSAKLNANGDGIEIVDTTVGTGRLKVEGLNNSSVAKDLNLAGEGVDFTAADGSTGQRVDGSHEVTVEIDAGDSLQDVRDKINDLGRGFRATIINDGTGSRPFRLVLNSQVSGTRGSMVLDTGGTGLSFDTLVRAQDAVVLFGGSSSDSPVVLASSTNTLSGVLEGVTINLAGTSDEAVELSVSEDVDSVVTDINTFVSSYNAVLDNLETATRFDAETNTRGPLFGNSTVNLIQSRLRSAVLAPVSVAQTGINRLTSIGISLGSGGRLSFDEDKFRELFASDPAAIETLFASEDEGLGDKLNEMLDDLTNAFDGVIERKDNLLENSGELLNDRIDQLQDLLDRKRTRLERQYQALESSLAGLQGAQNSLTTLARLISSGSLF